MTDKERDNILLAESRDEKDKIARDHRERNKDYTIYLKAGEYSAPDFISFITEVSSASEAAHDENCAGEQQEATTIVKRAERSENLTKTLDRHEWTVPPAASEPGDREKDDREYCPEDCHIQRCSTYTGAGSY